MCHACRCWLLEASVERVLTKTDGNYLSFSIFYFSPFYAGLKTIDGDEILPRLRTRQTRNVISRSIVAEVMGSRES